MSATDDNPANDAYPEEETAVDESKLKLPGVSTADITPSKPLEEEEDVLFKVYVVDFSFFRLCSDTMLFMLYKGKCTLFLPLLVLIFAGGLNCID